MSLVSKDYFKNHRGRSTALSLDSRTQTFPVLGVKTTNLVEPNLAIR